MLAPPYNALDVALVVVLIALIAFAAFALRRARQQAEQEAIEPERWHRDGPEPFEIVPPDHDWRWPRYESPSPSEIDRRVAARRA